jgi:branched-chain amino acid transport system permease protein
VVVYLIDQLIVKSIIPTGHQLVLGVLLVAMIVASPDGLLALVRKFMRKKDAAA